MRFYVSNLIKQILTFYDNSNFVLFLIFSISDFGFYKLSFHFFYFSSTQILRIPTPILRILTQIPRILTTIPCIPTFTPRIPIIPFPDFPFWLL